MFPLAATDSARFLSPCSDHFRQRTALGREAESLQPDGQKGRAAVEELPRTNSALTRLSDARPCALLPPELLKLFLPFSAKRIPVRRERKTLSNTGMAFWDVSRKQTGGSYVLIRPAVGDRRAVVS